MKTLTLGLTAIALVASTLTADVNLKACTSCHGTDFSKVALGKSKIVSDMSKEDIVTAMLGYKNGTYGGAMKGLMVGQVKKYSEDELKASADAILAAAGK
jgi:cytochrome c-type protein NapB